MRQTLCVHTAKGHGVGGHDKVIFRHIVLDELGPVKHGKAVAQIAQGVVHTGQRVGLVLVQRHISTVRAVVDLHVLHTRRAGSTADPDVLVVGLHPIGGIITAYVSVSCGYSANVFLSTLDPMIASVTQEAADRMNIAPGQTGPLCNYYFLFVSTFLLAFIINHITRRSLLPHLGMYAGDIHFNGYKQLSRKERRAMLGAVFAGLLYIAIILWATFSSWGILRSVNGGLIRSPFIVGILFLLSFGIGLMGMVYGFASGRYRTDGDVIEGLTQPMKLLGVYFVIAFFASQMFACFEYSHLDKCIAILGANLLSSASLSSLWILILFILFTALVNLFMVSATAKWAFMSFIFVPVLASMGISPDMTQCAFRIGDSATNAITPFMFYMPLVLTYMQQYDRQSTYGSLLKYTWRYSLVILLAWTALFVLWYISGLPLGL